MKQACLPSNPSKLLSAQEFDDAAGRLGERIYENPLPGCGPVLLATRIEAPGLPTFICYGHGDVVLGMEGRWSNDRDPWKLAFEGDRVYGRGVVDNKGGGIVMANSQVTYTVDYQTNTWSAFYTYVVPWLAVMIR